MSCTLGQTVTLAGRALDNLENAERVFREAPTRDEIDRRIGAARQEHLLVLSAHPEAEKILHWKGSVDARNLLRVQGAQIRVERLIKPLWERGIAHVLEPPSEANGYALSLYVDDPEPSSAVLEFEVYRLVP